MSKNKDYSYYGYRTTVWYVVFVFIRMAHGTGFCERENLKQKKTHTHSSFGTEWKKHSNKQTNKQTKMCLQTLYIVNGTTV